MIEVENLVRDYGGHLAMDRLSFRMEDGQIYGFLGPNGAGKSTTMSIMIGYLGAIEGQVIIDGHNILEEPEVAKKRVGYLSEVPSLHMDVTVDEYLEFVACTKKLPKPGRMNVIWEIIDLVKITNIRKRLTRNLSKSCRQRVGMAQAVSGKPSVIILDEPTAGLDSKQTIEIWDMIKGLDKQHTVIPSSHILSEVSAVCDHIIIIAHGKLIVSGTPENLGQRLKGAADLDLTVRGSTEVLRPMLGGTYGLPIGRMGADNEDGTCVAGLQFVRDGDIINLDNAELPNPEADIRGTILYTLASRRLLILPVAPSRASLREIFLELTKDYPKTRGDSGVVDPMDRSGEEEPQ